MTTTDPSLLTSLALDNARYCADGYYTTPGGKQIRLPAPVTILPDQSIPVPTAAVAERTRFATETKPPLELALQDLMDDLRPCIVLPDDPRNSSTKRSLAFEQFAAHTCLSAILSRESLAKTHVPEPADALMTDVITHIPRIPVIRNAEFERVNHPVALSAILVAPPRLSDWFSQATERPGRSDEGNDALRTRIERMLRVAAYQGYQSLILPPFGCEEGANPILVTKMFKELLHGAYRQVFTRVTFALPGYTLSSAIAHPFAVHFARDH